MKILQTMLAVVSVSGCVMAGTPFYSNENILKAPELGKSKLVFYWPKQQYDVSPSGARIMINNDIVESIGYLKYYTIDVEIGEYKIDVDTWNNPGRCRVEISTSSDEVRFFEIQTRSSYIEKTEISNIFSPLPGVDLLAAAFIAGESIGKDCGGVFSIIEVSQTEAFKRMHRTLPGNPNKSSHSAN